MLRHLKDYISSEKLTPENGGSSGYLTVIQTMALIEHLTEHTYHHTHQVICYLMENFCVKYTIYGMNKWLHHNGFSYKMPKGVPHKFDEAKQQAFVEAYEALKVIYNKDESILFIDAVHPTPATKISHGWIRTGQDKSLETTGIRSRLNILSALNLSDIAGSLTSRVTDNFQILKSTF